MFPLLTHLLEGERGQTGRDCIQTRKRGGGSPIVPPKVGDREWEGNHVRSGPPQTWTEPSLCLPGVTIVRGKEASEEPGKTLIVACKPVQDKSCTGSGLHLPVPPNYGNPG